MTSNHARHRMQQRSVPPLVVAWLLDFGKVRYDHRGGIIYYFDKDARRNLERAVGRRVVSRLSDYMNVYAVSSTNDNTLVTVGHRYRRFNLG
jgi:hypothetical protein